MTKFVKMSLAAAVAVAGLSSTASAQSLEEAIKGVDVSGSFKVGYDRTTQSTSGDTGNGATNDASDLDIDVTFKAPISDNVTAILGVQADSNEDFDTASNTYEPVDVNKHYISIASSVATINVGKQGVGTPFFDDEVGIGAVALIPAGPVTAAVANFSNINGNATAIRDADIFVAAVLGKFGMVDASVWYASSAKVATAYTVAVSAPVGPVTIDARQTNVDYADLYATDGDSPDADAKGKAFSLTKVAVSMDINAFSLTAAVGMTSDDEQNGVGVQLANDSDADVNFAGEIYDIGTKRDASAQMLAASTKVSDVTVGAHYLKGSYKPATNTEYDFSEYKVSASYPVAKATTVSAFYAAGSVDVAAGEQDDTSMEIAIKHTF